MSTSGRNDDAVPVRRIVSRVGDAAANSPFDFPSFDEHPFSSQTFQQLTDNQLACYRDVLRQAMDAEVAGFDPDVIHVQDIWVMGHLVRGRGPVCPDDVRARVPVACRLDSRFRRWVEETAENAGRILAADEATRREVIALFGELDGRVLTPPSDYRASAAGAAQWLGGVYRDVRQERFGTLPEG